MVEREDVQLSVVAELHVPSCKVVVPMLSGRRRSMLGRRLGTEAPCVR
jgi:hypothetical protein